MFCFVLISGNNIALLCNKFRDATISRAITLTDPIRGTSLHDVETNIAFPVGFGGSCLAVNSHGKDPTACVQNLLLNAKESQTLHRALFTSEIHFQTVMSVKPGFH